MDEQATTDLQTQSEKSEKRAVTDPRLLDPKYEQRLEQVGLCAIATVTMTESWQETTGGRADRWRDHVLSDPWDFIAWAEREGFGVMGWLTVAGEARCRAAISVWCEGLDNARCRPAVAEHALESVMGDEALNFDPATGRIAQPDRRTDVAAGVGGQ